MGNQLFQHVAALKYSDDPRYIIEARRGAERPTLSEVLSVNGERLTRTQKWVLGDFQREWPGWKRAVAHGARPAVSRLHRYDSITQGPDECAAPPPDLGSPQRLFLNGYFQHPGFYEPRLSRVCQDLLERAPEGRVGDDVVALSFRRGDFVDLGWALELGYYQSALAIVNPDRRRPLWIVSEDLVFADLAADRFRSEGYDVLPNPDFGRSPAMNDFWALGFAECLIASNSTFAWWAGAVGDAFRGVDHHQVVVPSVFDDATVRLRQSHWLSAPSQTS